jgi:hypothetical protein
VVSGGEGGGGTSSGGVGDDGSSEAYPRTSVFFLLNKPVRV